MKWDLMFPSSYLPPAGPTCNLSPFSPLCRQTLPRLPWLSPLADLGRDYDGEFFLRGLLTVVVPWLDCRE